MIPNAHPVGTSVVQLFRRSALALAGLVALTPPQSVAAETAPEPEVVYVTATRTEQRADDIPAATSVLDTKAIQRGRTLLGLDEALNIVPGVFIQNRHNFAQDERISIRGFGARASFGIRGVAVIIDGIPATLPDGQSQVDSIDLGSAERIEVLRGPASALYGNAAGGVIRIISETGPQPAEVRLRQTIGAYGMRRSQLQGGGAWEHADFMLSVNRLEADGFRDHNAVEQRQLNGKWRWHPSERTHVTAVTRLFDSPTAQDPGGVTAARAKRAPEAARQANQVFDGGESVEQQTVGVRLAHDPDNRQRLEIGGFITARDFAGRLPFESGGQVAFERDFTGFDGRYEIEGAILGYPNRLTVGVDYRMQEDDRRRYDNLAGTRGPLVVHQLEEVTSRAIYAQDRLELGKRWALTAALRWDDVALDVSDRLLADGDDGGERDWRELSPSVGLLWQAHDRITLYANLGTAFQTPTTTELANPDDPGSGGGFNPNLEPQRARNYELGLRSDLGSGVHIEANVFRTRIDDAITTFEVPRFSGTGRDFFRNAGASRRDGLELALRARPLERVSARVSYAYLDATFETFRTPDGIFDDNHLPGVPKHQLDIRVSYETPRDLFAEAELHAVGDFEANNANTAKNRGYTLLDLRAGRRWQLGSWRLGAFIGVNNLTKERYNENVRVNAFGGRFFEPGPDRHAYGGLDLTRTFNR